MFTRYLWWFILTNASISKHMRLLEVSSLESIGLFGWTCHVNMSFNGMKQELLSHWFLGLRWFRMKCCETLYFGLAVRSWSKSHSGSSPKMRFRCWNYLSAVCGSTWIKRPFFFQVLLLFHILEPCSVEVKLLSTPHDWDLILLWLPTASPSPVSSRALIQLWHGTIYGLQTERNKRFNLGLSRDDTTILSIIVRMIKNKSTALRNLECRFGDDIVSLWSGI